MLYLQRFSYLSSLNILGCDIYTNNLVTKRPFHKEYNGRKLVGYSDVQMYSVVADVKNYENFLPFCNESHILVEKPDFLQAKLVIGFPPIMESYISNVNLSKPTLVHAVCTEGHLLHYLETTWNFSPGLKNNPRTCIIDFTINFKFKSFLHSQLANFFFDNLAATMEQAFISEAKRRYGAHSIPTHELNGKS